MAQMRSASVETVLILLLLVGGCKREPRTDAGALTASLIFDNASPEVSEALAANIDFRINDDNFERWAEAQSNLEELPPSAINLTSATRGDAVQRAVARLESSPVARRAIENAGLSVRDFVLETIALAQATEIARTGRSITRTPVPAENFQFVQRYYAQVLRARAEPRVATAVAESDELGSDSAELRADQIEMQIQMRLDEADHQIEMRLAEAEMRRELAERVREVQREQTEMAAEMRRAIIEHQAEMRREYAEAQRERRAMSRDTVPAPR